MKISSWKIGFRGRDTYRGLYLSNELHDERELRSRVLQSSQAADRIYRTELGYVIYFAQPRRLCVESSLGSALSQAKDAAYLLSLPLTPKEAGTAFRRSKCSEHSVCIAKSGQLEWIDLSRTAIVDTSQWWTLSDFSWIQADDFVAPPQVVARPQPSVDISARLAPGAPQFTPSRERALEKLRAQARQTAQTSRSRKGGNASHADDTRQSMGWLARGRRMLGRLAMATPGLRRFFAERTDRYMQDLVEMFDSGNFDDALRHAIPLGGQSDSHAQTAADLPSPRAELRITRGEQSFATTTLVSGNMDQSLRRAYHEAARQLETKGDIDQAAYVLFELLRDNHGGVALLERHRRFELAAEIAEGRAMSPELVARLWIQAKEPAKAIAVARRTGCFAQTVGMLELRKEHEDAQRLRLLWADQAAGFGDFASAVEAVWPIESARKLAARWIEEALPFAGPDAKARLLVQQTCTNPGALSEVLSQIAGELNCDEPYAARFRLALARELDQLQPETVRARLATELARAVLIHDSQGPYASEASRVMASLKKANKEQVFFADLQLRQPCPLAVPNTSPLPACIKLPQTDQGQHCATDIAALANGGALVALGESGMVLLGRMGKVRSRIHTPADLVRTSTNGTWALAVKNRGQVRQLFRINLVTGSARWWYDTKFDILGSQIVGGLFFVADRNGISALDIAATQPRAIWRVTLAADEQVLAMHVDDERLGALVAGPNWVEYWDFELPKLTLRRRQELLLEEARSAAHEDGPGRWTLKAGSKVVLLGYVPHGSEISHLSRFDLRSTTPKLSPTAIEGNLQPLFAGNTSVIWSESLADGKSLIVAGLDFAKQLQIECIGVSSMQAVVAGNATWVADNLGRVWHYDLESGGFFGPWRIDGWL